MSSEEQALQFLQQGIAAAKGKQNDRARRLLQNAVRLDASNETAWLWLSSVAKDNQERIFCLQQVLQLNPENEMALKGLHALGTKPVEPTGTAPRPRSAIPQPTAEQIAAAQQALPELIARATAQEDPYSGIDWVHKRRNRAGERAATLFLLAVRVVPVLLLVGLLGIGAYYLSQNPDAIVLAPTWTPSYTPSPTSTPTPGFTPTPSATPQETYTSTPPLDPDLPAGNLSAGMTSTPVYPRLEEGRIIQEAVMHIDVGEDSIALPTLSALREALLDANINPNPFYYEAVALANTGELEEAESLLQEGVERLEQANGSTGLLLAGQAYVASVQEDYSASNQLARAALEMDPALPQPYYTLARNALYTSRYDEAEEILAEAIERHPADVNLYLLRGELNLASDQPADAQQDARIALHIDPTAQEAYLLQARADIGVEDYGLAVLHLQDYLFVYPGSIEGWTLLGDTRALEGNPDLAIAAYSRAVNTEETLDSQIPALMDRAAIYARREQYSKAIIDYTRILNLRPDDAVAREMRAQTALQAGRYHQAMADINILLEEAPARPDLRLLKAVMLVDGANPRNAEAYEQALDDALEILAGDFPMDLTDALRPAAYEYRARVLIERGQYEDALNDINEAVTGQESGTRRYLRARIHEALGNAVDARRDYAYLQRWGAVYPYPFQAEVSARLEDLGGG